MVFGVVSLSPADNAAGPVWSRPRDGNQTVLTESMEKLGMQLFPWTDAPLWPPSAPLRLARAPMTWSALPGGSCMVTVRVILRLQMRYDQPIDHLSGGADDVIRPAVFSRRGYCPHADGRSVSRTLAPWQGRTRSRETSRATRDPKPFAGLTRKPDCPACEQGAGALPRYVLQCHVKSLLRPSKGFLRSTCNFSLSAMCPAKLTFPDGKIIF